MDKPDDKTPTETPKAPKPPGYGKLMALLKRALSAPPQKRKK
jgi:hypothetical protein